MNLNYDIQKIEKALADIIRNANNKEIDEHYEFVFYFEEALKHCKLRRML